MNRIDDIIIRDLPVEGAVRVALLLRRDYPEDEDCRIVADALYPKERWVCGDCGNTYGPDVKSCPNNMIDMANVLEYVLEEEKPTKPKKRKKNI